jgi:hypothetical protein
VREFAVSSLRVIHLPPNFEYCDSNINTTLLCVIAKAAYRFTDSDKTSTAEWLTHGRFFAEGQRNSMPYVGMPMDISLLWL